MRIVYKRCRNSGNFVAILGNTAHEFRERNGELQSRKLCEINKQTVKFVSAMADVKTVPVNIAIGVAKLVAKNGK